jgi:hypothetical protein
MDIQNIRIGSLIIPGLMMTIFYIFTVFFNLAIVFIIGLNAILIFIMVVDYTRYRPKYLYHLENAAIVGVIIFFFVILQNIYWVMVS